MRVAEKLDRYPVEALEGTRWKELILDEIIPLSDHFLIASQTLLQVTDILESTGVLLRDRQPWNIIFTIDRKVKQVDTDIIFDVLNNSCIRSEKINTLLWVEERRAVDMSCVKIDKGKQISNSYFRRVLDQITTTLIHACTSRGYQVYDLYPVIQEHVEATLHAVTIGDIVAIYRSMLAVIENEAQKIQTRATTVTSDDYVV